MPSKILILIAGLVLGIALVSWNDDEAPRFRFFRELPAETEPLALTETGRPTASALQAEEQRTVEVFEAVAPAVVFITSQVEVRDYFSLNVMEVPQGAGSGFYWDEKGHIVTNFHVVHQAGRLMVRRSGEEKSYEAEVVGTAPSKDLAVLRIRAPRSKIVPVRPGKSADLKVGQTVLAIGNPFGLDHSLSTGIISALGREIQALNGRTIRNVIQTDAAINPGNSGGPLLDFQGRLIGMNTAIYSASGASAGVGFAVPVDTIAAIVPQLIEEGKYTRPSFGVNLVSDTVSRRMGFEGLIVQAPTPGGPADEAGIRGIGRDAAGEPQLGDVITEIAGKPVTTVDELIAELETHKVGEEIEVTVLRGGEKKQRVKVRLGSSEDVYEK